MLSARRLSGKRRSCLWFGDGVTGWHGQAKRGHVRFPGRNMAALRLAMPPPPFTRSFKTL
ncbi:MAG: hypothetical protein MI923_01875 [Phycisphaerales bacterium]|nr:hypothetical protein [Phycisphaerales bacterium]